MTPPDQIELKLTPHDYAWGHILHQWLLPLKKPKAWVFIAAALILGLWLNVSLNESHPRSLLSYFVAFAILIPAWLTKEYLFVYHHYRKTSQPNCRISLLENGLHYQYEKFDHLYAWSEMRAMTLVGRFTFLRVGGRRFLILSRSAFDSPEHYASWQRRLRHYLDEQAGRRV